MVQAVFLTSVPFSKGYLLSRDHVLKNIRIYSLWWCRITLPSTAARNMVRLLRKVGDVLGYNSDNHVAASRVD